MSFVCSLLFSKGLNDFEQLEAMNKRNAPGRMHVLINISLMHDVVLKWARRRFVMIPEIVRMVLAGAPCADASAL